MFRSVGLTWLLAAALLTCGCFGGHETDAVTYVVAVGIDETEDKEVLVTYQIAVPRALGGEGGGGGQKPSTLISVRATNLAEGRSLLNSISSRRINLSHIKVFVFGEKYARKGMSDFMSVAMRFQEFRGSMFICVVQNGTAKELMESNKPKQDNLPSRAIENLFASTADSGYFLSSQIHEFYRRLKSNKGSPYAALVGVNPQRGDGEAEGLQVKNEKAKDYTAGNIPRSGAENAIEMLGTAVFSGDKMVGTLTGQETRMISMLQGKFGQGFLVAVDPLVPDKSVNVLLRLARSPKITCRLDDGQLRISADVALEGEITSLPSGIHYESGKYSQLIEQQISQVIEREMSHTLRKTQALGSDVVGFGAYSTNLFTSYDELAKFDFEGLYPQAEITLTVKTIIRRTGLMWKTTPLPNKDQK